VERQLVSERQNSRSEGLNSKELKELPVRPLSSKSSAYSASRSRSLRSLGSTLGSGAGVIDHITAEEEEENEEDEELNAMDANFRRSMSGGGSSFFRVSFERRVPRHVVGGIVVFNLLCIGFETDGTWPGHWGAVDMAFVAFYVIEMLLRVGTFGRRMFTFFTQGIEPTSMKAMASETIVNIIDLLLVLTGVAECCVRPMMTQSRGLDSLGKFLMHIRLLRCIRLFTLFDNLQNFIVALRDMTDKLSWIFGVIGLVSYVSAVFITQYSSDDASLHELTRDIFPDVLTSLFSLFQVSTMDNWHDIAAPLIEHQGIWRIFFGLFIAFTSWTMISLLTAVISDQILVMTRTLEERETRTQEKKRLDFVAFLHRCFMYADADGNGFLDKDEFEMLINEDIVTKKMDELGISIPHEELAHTFDMLDVDENGELTIQEFTMGLSQLQQSISIKHVLSINYALQRAQNKLLKLIDSQFDEKDRQIQHLLEYAMSIDEKLTDADVGMYSVDSKLDDYANHRGLLRGSLVRSSLD